jgi:hypothetical protein
MRTLDEMMPGTAEIIAAHCAGTRAREEFVQACLRAQWAEAQAMVKGMLASRGTWLDTRKIACANYWNCCGRRKPNLRNRTMGAFSATMA